MKRHRPIRVLILTHSADSAERWAQALRGPDTQIWLSAGELPSSLRPDVVVTNEIPHEFLPAMSPDCVREHPATPASLELAAPVAPSFDDRPGMIVVGTDTCGPADVCLPIDVSPRELRSSCRLLAEVVRLRRALLTRAITERCLVREALTDPLTGLPNRRAWDRRLGELRVSGAFCERAFCLVILDLDHFKQINDASGHAVGDRVLQAVGQTLAQNLRHGDFVARLGGDEFGLVLPLSDLATARSVVDRVRRVLPPGLTNAGLPVVTASAGLCLFDPASSAAPRPSVDTIFAAADTALRNAKSEGRDRTVPATPET